MIKLLLEELQTKVILVIWPSRCHIRATIPECFNNTHREELNSAQEFVRIKSWLLLIFYMCLFNQLKFH